MVVETERLFLREMNEDDYDALYSVLADSDVMQHYPYTFDEKRVRGWIAKNIDRCRMFGFGLWAVCLKGSGEMIGDCGLTLQNINGRTLPEIGSHILRDCQRKGYVKEAAKAVRDWAFRNTDYPALYSYCKYANAPSIRTAESIGMRFGCDYSDAANGITHVSVISKEDWLTYDEGLCVQCMHVGSYDDEPTTVARMHEHMVTRGYVLDITSQRMHHEIYLSDARKVAPEKLKTVIRHPIRKG